MSWTDDRVETLKKMWGEGQSASQIAKELGGVTRNAVIGKVHQPVGHRPRRKAKPNRRHPNQSQRQKPQRPPKSPPSRKSRRC
jgi:GcrA cell cycle regulator